MPQVCYGTSCTADSEAKKAFDKKYKETLGREPGSNRLSHGFAYDVIQVLAKQISEVSLSAMTEICTYRVRFGQSCPINFWFPGNNGRNHLQ
jgi:hypothetical protein